MEEVEEKFDLDEESLQITEVFEYISQRGLSPKIKMSHSEKKSTHHHGKDGKTVDTEESVTVEEERDL